MQLKNIYKEIDKFKEEELNLRLLILKELEGKKFKNIHINNMNIDKVKNGKVWAKNKISIYAVWLTTDEIILLFYKTRENKLEDKLYEIKRIY